MMLQFSAKSGNPHHSFKDGQLHTSLLQSSVASRFGVNVSVYGYKVMKEWKMSFKPALLPSPLQLA